MNIFTAASLFFLQTEQSLQKVEPKQTEEKQLQAIAQMTHPARSVMIIDPKLRASDYMRAFELLRQEKSTAKVYFEIADGTKISNVIDMKIMPGNTLVVFHFSTPQGVKFQAVELEDILGIKYY